TGNVNGFLMVAFAVVWQVRTRDYLVAGLVGTLAAWKIFPGMLLIWLVASRRWRAAGLTLILTCAWGLAALLIAGPSATWTYVTQVVPSTQAMGISLAFLFTWAPLTFVLLAVGTIATLWLGPMQPKAGYLIALLTAVLAWPSLGPASLSMLMAVPAVVRSEAIIR
ncbi:MAG TPA: glycosyltransferase 87 family protein, partial [Candidatus Sulfotelmatobacter sp.]|nr:glycosyltransferase 87 family protein [Candidatus Sulfotelmatobacter sp.]